MLTRSCGGCPLPGELPPSRRSHPALRYFGEKYTKATGSRNAAERLGQAFQPAFRGGLPIRQLREVEDFVREKLAGDISLAVTRNAAEGEAGLSCVGIVSRTKSFHFLASSTVDRHDSAAIPIPTSSFYLILSSSQLSEYP